MTVQEHLDASRWKRFSYRLSRNPFVLFVIAPIAVFVILQGFPSPKASRRERQSVAWMNLALLCVVTVMSWLYGIVPYLLIQSVAWVVAGAAGIWLFSVQDQFEDVYWERGENWDYAAAALADPGFQRVKPITLLSSPKSLAFRLWDEPAGKLIGCGRMRQLRREQRRQRSRKS